MATKPTPDAASPAVSNKGSKKLLIMGGGAAVLLIVLGVGGWLIFGGKAEPHAEEAAADGKAVEGKAAGKAAPIYHALDPAFVANLADEDGGRYLQVEIQVMARDQAAIDAVELHKPVIRNQLLLIFSEMKVEDLRTREAREGLQKKALEEIQRILKEQTGKPGIEALYFTSFVTQ